MLSSKGSAVVMLNSFQHPCLAIANKLDLSSPAQALGHGP
jgi:hypothetical protein